MIDIKVEKRNGQIVDFESERLEKGIRKAFNKRNIDNNKVEEVVRLVIDDIVAIGKPTSKATRIGKIVLKNLRDIDEAAYLCFWAMFGNFETAEEFNKLLVQFQKDYK
jgi:transcriptional repressor NrdR